MTWFEARRESHAVVPAERAAVWGVLTDPSALARLTPLVESIEADGELWHWKLSGLSVLGKDLAPSFTERMSLSPQERIDFTHDPQGKEKAGSEGTYELSDADGGTSLRIDLTVKVDLPLPGLSRGAVRATMNGVIAQMGNGFADNLAKELGY